MGSTISNTDSNEHKLGGSGETSSSKKKRSAHHVNKIMLMLLPTVSIRLISLVLSLHVLVVVRMVIVVI